MTDATRLRTKAEEGRRCLLGGWAYQLLILISEFHYAFWRGLYSRCLFIFTVVAHHSRDDDTSSVTKGLIPRLDDKRGLLTSVILETCWRLDLLVPTHKLVCASFACQFRASDSDISASDQSSGHCTSHDSRDSRVRRSQVLTCQDSSQCVCCSLKVSLCYHAAL